VTTRRLVITGVVLSLFLAGVVSFYASSHPDGLEYVAGKVGFADSATVHDASDSPFAGYSTRGVDDARLSGGVAGVIGATAVFVLAGGLFLALRRRGTSTDTGVDSDDER
jgi:hypothetical protein